jgi:hypothetical protein
VPTTDGQLPFLAQMIAPMRPTEDGMHSIAAVFNGPSLSTSLC